MPIGQAEGPGSKVVAAGRMRDHGGTGREPQLAEYVCHVAVDAALADHDRALGRGILPFVCLVAVVACGTSTCPQALESNARDRATHRSASRRKAATRGLPIAQRSSKAA
jgi:hypothetical protein